MSDYYAILASCAAIRAAYNQHDAALLLAQFASAFTLIPDAHATIEGPAAAVALREQTEALFRDFDVYCAESVPYVTQLGGTAWVWGQERLRLTAHNTRQKQYRCYRVTRVWRRFDDGSWKITFQMHQPDLAGLGNPADLDAEQEPGIG